MADLRISVKSRGVFCSFSRWSPAGIRLIIPTVRAPNYFIEDEGVALKESGEELPAKKGDFAIVLPGEKHQYRNTSADKDLVMICAVPKEYA